MEQRDYLQKQIDLLGKVLGKILADLLGAKNEGNLENQAVQAKQQLQGELDLNISELLQYPDADFIKWLSAEKKFTDEHFEKLAEIMILLGESAETENQKALYQKCLVIYSHLEETGNTYSVDRHERIERLKKSL